MKKILMFLTIFVFILSISTSFADNSTDVLAESGDDGMLGDSLDIYVSNDGSDSLGDGSADKPYKTLNHTINVVPDNSKIYLKSGTYNSTGYEIKNKSLSITGIGEVTVDGLNGEISQNIFKVYNGSSLVLNNIRFVNGFANLEGSLSPIINEGNLNINNCYFNNFTTINGAILNKNSLTIDNVSDSKLKIDWKSVFGQAGNIGFEYWIQQQIKNNPSRGEFVTNIGDCAIFNSKLVATVYNNRNMNVTNSYLSTFISNRSYDIDIKSIIDKSQIMSLRVSNNTLLVVNDSFVDPCYDELWYTNAIIQNSTYYNESVYYSMQAHYCNLSIKSSSFNKNLDFDRCNVNVTHSTILGHLSAGLDTYVNANYNWWGSNRGPFVSGSAYSTIISKYWIVMSLDVVNDVVSVDFTKYTNGASIWDLKNVSDVNSRFVKLEIEIGKFGQSHGYLVNGSFRTELIGENLNTMLYAKVDNQLLRFAVGEGLTNYTWYVSDSTGNDYFCDGSYENPFKTMLKAVSKAFNGNTIYVMEGVYTLSWNANLKISKNLTFVGLGNAVLSRPNARNIFIVDEKGILNIENFNFTTVNKGYTDPLIYLTGGSVNIKNSNFNDLPLVFGIIYAYESDSIYLDNVTFEDFQGGAIVGNSSYICVNNTRFLSDHSTHSTYDVIEVKSSLDILNSRFENINNGLVLINKRGYYSSVALKTYIYNTTFINNNWINREIFGLTGMSKTDSRKYTVIDSCYFLNNRGHLVTCDIINNSTFINNTDVPFIEYYPEGALAVHYYPQTLIRASELINNSYFYGNELPSTSHEQRVIESPYVYNSVFINNMAAYGVLSEPKEVHYCVFMNNTGIYGVNDVFVYKGDLDISSNWWGSNQKPDSSRVQIFVGNLTIRDWVILNLTQDGDKIIASLDNLVDNNKNIYRLNHTLPSRIVEFKTDNGEIRPVKTSLVNNHAVATLVKNTTFDFDVYATVDNQIVSLTIYNNSTLLLIDDVTFYGKENKYKIALINVNGHKISSQLIEAVVTSSNGFRQPYTLTTDQSGVVYLNIDYPIGFYNIEVYYYGNGYFDKTSARAVINISSISTSIYSHNYTYWGKNNRFYAILTDELGRHLLNESLVLEVYNLKDKLLTSVVVMTGTYGTAETLLSLDTGSYKVKWNYLGSNWYGSSFSYSYIIVKPVNTTISLPNSTFYGKGNDYEFTFTDIYGNKISGETVTLRISNGTDSRDFKIKVEKGLGSININLLPGTYSLFAIYAGDNIYGPSSAEAVLDIQRVFITFDFKSYATIPENGVFSAILNDMYGKRVEGQNVSLELYDNGLYRTYNALSDANGEVSFRIDAVEGIYFAIINFNGSTWYKPSTGAATVEVSHSVSTGRVYLDGDDYAAYYGENGYYTISFNDTNKLSLKGMKIPIVISSGEFSKSLTGESDEFGNVRVQITLEPGIYDITYKYDNAYYGIHDSKTNKISIYRMPTSIIVSDMIVKQGDGRNLEVKLLDKNGAGISNLPVKIRIGNKSYNVSTNAFGLARLPLDLNLGYHTVECFFDNENYISSATNATILVVDDSRTVTSMESVETYSQEGKLFNYTVTLFDTLDNPIKSSQIILNLTDGENNFIGSYECYTDGDGKAAFNLTLTYGTYIAKAYYPGNEVYFESFNTNHIYIKPLENITATILFGNDMEIINGYNQFYSVVLKTISGDFISNASVEFVVGNRSYFSTTDDAGRAFLNVPFKPGVFEVNAKFSGSDNLTKAYTTNHIRVSGELLYLYSQDVVKSFNNGTHYYVALFDALGHPLAGKIIKFTIGNETYQNITDGDGFACFEVWLNPGDYNITATYQGPYPDEYESVSNNITVLTTLISEDISKYYNGKTALSAEFLDYSNNPLANTEVVFNINGANYKVKTSNIGKAVLKIDLNPGNYKLSILNTKTGQIAVNSVKISSTLTTANLVKYYKNSKKFKATFKDKNGNLLKNTYVKFTLKGKTYKVKTNSKGVATLKINLKPGKYTITTLNTKTAEKHSNKITIKKTIITKNKKVKKGKKINFQAKILKTNGKIVKKVTVKFTINKKVYKVKTNSKGIAKLNIKLKKGKYIVKTTYNGLTVKNTVRCI